jgi:hypothetical protein
MFKAILEHTQTNVIEECVITVKLMCQNQLLFHVHKTVTRLRVKLSSLLILRLNSNMLVFARKCTYVVLLSFSCRTEKWPFLIRKHRVCNQHSSFAFPVPKQYRSGKRLVASVQVLYIIALPQKSGVKLCFYAPESAVGIS